MLKTERKMYQGDSRIFPRLRNDSGKSNFSSNQKPLTCYFHTEQKPFNSSKTLCNFSRVMKRNEENA